MIRNLIRYGALLTALGLGACEEQLAVENPNDPDTRRVLATPADAEALLGGYYKRWHDAMYNGTGNFEGMANIMALQNYSSLANDCQNSRAPFSGASNPNNPGNVCGGNQNRLYAIHNEVARVASSFITTMNAVTTGGDLFLGTPSRDNRGRAFAEFLRGISLGYIAMYYDSSAISAPGMAGDDPGVLRPYTEVADSSFAALQRAIDAATGTGGMDALVGTWLPSPTVFNAVEFVKLIRSYRARFRAGMARTPTERGLEDWNAIIADAQNGISADHYNILSSTTGPYAGWRDNYDGAGLWHQMPPFIIGMGDVSGSYAAWIAQAVGDRGSGNQSFFMVTPDLRFPQGGTRAAQQADFLVTSCESGGAICKRYFINRSTADQFAGLGFGWSNYDWKRNHAFFTAGDAGSARNGKLVFMTKAEMDMLEAEGQFRNGQFAAAAALINKTRVPNGLAQIVAFDATTPMPDCIPRHPTAAAPTTLTCGTMFEALKWEKRIETAFTHFIAWFPDSRGWGDLPKDIPLFWAVPYQDLQARGYATSAIYGTGVGVGNAPNSTAALSTYGW